MDIRNVNCLYFKDFLCNEIALVQCKTTKEVHCWKSGQYIGMIKKEYINKVQNQLNNIKGKILNEHTFLDKALEV